MTDLKPTLLRLRQVRVFADRQVFTALVDYGDDRPLAYGFNGPTNGVGPVYVTVPDWEEPLLVNSPERFGDAFNASWIRRYWA